MHKQHWSHTVWPPGWLCHLKCGYVYSALLFSLHTVVVLLGWAAELHHNRSLTPPPQRGTGRKYNQKGSRVEIRTGRKRSTYCDWQNRLSIGRQ